MISEETRRKLSESRTGEKNHRFGTHPSEETRRKNSEAIKKLWEDPEYRRRIIEANINKHPSEETRKKIGDASRGRKQSEEDRKKKSVAAKKRWENLDCRRIQSERAKRQFEDPEQRRTRSEARKGKNNPNYIDGRSYDPYPPIFDESFKRKTRLDYGNVCLFPGCCKTPEEEGRELSVHHYDYNQNSLNCIPLCNAHNLEVNKNREYWEEYFTDLVGFYWVIHINWVAA